MLNFASDGLPVSAPKSSILRHVSNRAVGRGQRVQGADQVSQVLDVRLGERLGAVATGGRRGRAVSPGPSAGEGPITSGSGTGTRVTAHPAAGRGQVPARFGSRRARGSLRRSLGLKLPLGPITGLTESGFAAPAAGPRQSRRIVDRVPGPVLVLLWSALRRYW